MSMEISDGRFREPLLRKNSDNSIWYCLLPLIQPYFCRLALQCSFNESWHVPHLRGGSRPPFRGFGHSHRGHGCIFKLLLNFGLFEGLEVLIMGPENKKMRYVKLLFQNFAYDKLIFF